MEKQKNNYYKGVLNLNIAETLFYLNQYDQAIKSNLKAIKQYSSSNSNYGIAIAQYNLGKIYLEQGLLNKAKEYFQESIKLSKDGNYLDYLDKNYLELHDLFLRKKNDRQALISFKNHSRYQKQLKANNENSKLNNLELRYELQEIEDELTIKNSQIELLNKDKQLSFIKIHLLLYY